MSRHPYADAVAALVAEQVFWWSVAVEHRAALWAARHPGLPCAACPDVRAAMYAALVEEQASRVAAIERGERRALDTGALPVLDGESAAAFLDELLDLARARDGAAVVAEAERATRGE